jgi:hypothetical protein
VLVFDTRRSHHVRPLKITLAVIGTFQLVLGLVFLIAPARAAAALGLTPVAPGWANWLFAMMAARFLGYAYGMFVAARHPERATAWIDMMIVIQAIDWIGTIAYLVAGDVTLRQVTTAAFMPVMFVGALLWFHPRRHSTVDVNATSFRELALRDTAR